MKNLGKIIYIYLSLLFIAFLCYFLFSCSNMSTGLGEEVDLEAPVISVKKLTCENIELTSFSGGVYCKRAVAFSGSASDNNKISRVYTQIKWADDENSEFKDFKKANLSGGNWSVDLAFEREGVCYIKFVAEDPAKNISPKSTKVVTLFVDDTAPVASAWYIDREINGIQYGLKEKEELEALDLSLPENKDAAQNVAFTIKSNFNDTMGINKDSVKIRLVDEEGNKICDVSNTGLSAYAPEFKITHDALVGGKESLKTGKHFIKVLYTAEDIVSVPDSNLAENIEIDGGWFIWWPESDEPKISQKQIEIDAEGNESINVFINDVISLDVFDDDELQKAYCALLTMDEYNALGSPDWSLYEANPEKLLETASGDAPDENGERKRAKSYTANSGEREKTFILYANSKPDTMHLLAIAWDNTAAHKVIKKDIAVRVVDATAPILLITSPANNSTPVVAMSDNNTKAKFDIEGQALDSIGCTYLELVWVPDSVTIENKGEKAREWLEAIKSESAHEELIGKTKTQDGMKLWGIRLSNKTEYNGFQKNTFKLEGLDLLSDFGEEKASDKVFVAKLTRKDGNFVYADYRLKGDTIKPKITGIVPTVDMEVIDTSNDLWLEFKAEKSTGLAIKEYSIKRVDVSSDNQSEKTYPGEVTAEGTYRITTPISKGNTGDENPAEGTVAYWYKKNVKPKFRFTAVDILGNSEFSEFTLVVSNKPQLKAITSTAPNLCKKGDEIIITASFSGSVFVDESLTGESRPYIKLKNITNSDKSITAETIVPAYYKAGSGTTTLQFSYMVNENDSSTGLIVSNDKDNGDYASGPIAGAVTVSKTSTESALLNTLSDDSNLQAKKTIVIDGILPKIGTPVISTSLKNGENEHGSIKYLREGRTLTVSVTASETIFVQGAPTFVFNNIELPFTNCSGTTITFSKKISKESDRDGQLSYVPSSCITDYATITDRAGNVLSLESSSTASSVNIAIDTTPPEKPSIKKEDGTAFDTSTNKLNIAVKFVVVSTDSDVASKEYSTSGGNSWITYEGPVTQSSSAQLTARVTDRAGNVSEYADTVNLDFGDFPSFSLECTDPDGNYKAGQKLHFKLSFSSLVNVNDETAYIVISPLKAGQVVGTQNDRNRAILTSGTCDETQSIEFEYQIQDPDEFDLKVAASDVKLTGIVDMYGNTQESNTLAADYKREYLHCDGVAPKVISMTPQGTKNTANDGLNVYTQGNKIILKFSEEVQKSSGNLILRQVAGWGIPPVLRADDFTKIINKLSSDEDKENLAIGASIGKYAEDMEDEDKGIHYANDNYHGTGQYIGPYKKSSQGLLTNNEPDTATKFVLDFDMGIWETNTPHYFGTTFEDGKSQTTNTSATNRVKVYDGDKKGGAKAITVNQIRNSLEKAGYHERVLDVTSSSGVVIGADKKTVTITFPKGLCDTSSDLPDGREWELVIEKGAFMDMTGNEFGANSVGLIEKKDSIQSAGEQTEDSATWGRYRSSVTSGKGVVLIKNDTNESFWSDKVAKPWIRVDRYSYGLGIYQSDANGNRTTYIGNHSTAPTGYARVRIDCETKDAVIKYNKKVTENVNTGTENTENKLLNKDEQGYNLNNSNSNPDNADPQCDIYITSTTMATDITPSLDYPITINGTQKTNFFAVGTGNYQKGFRGYIVANAIKSKFTESETGTEGVFQTVARIVRPTKNNTSNITADQGAGYNDFSIRGTTGWGGEPSISPFPLRDSKPGSPYLRRCYLETSSKDYYWVSYEVLVESSVSGYSYGQGGGNYWGFNWCKNWGYIKPGETSRIEKMKNWEG